jgi:MFS family permease
MTATAVRPQTPANRRMMLIALIVISAFNYVDRTILSILQIPIKAELGLSDGQLGALTGLAFALFYATLSLPIARLADRYSRRWIIVISLVVWSAMTAMCGFATGFVSLLFFRVGVAIGEAGSVPASVSLIADSYAPERRATAMSTWGLALPIGLMIGYVCTGWLAEHLGWRLAFAVVGGVGVLLGPIVFAMIKEPARGRFEAGSAQGIVEPPPPLAQAVRIYGGGWLSDRLVARDPRGRLWLKAGSVAAVVPFALVQYLAPSTTVSIVAAAITSAMMIAYYGPILATTQSVVAPTMRAFSNAVLLLTFNLFGLGLGPWVTGLLSDALTGTFGDQALRYALAIVLIPSALATLTFLFAARFQSTDGVAASPAGVTDHA